MFAEREMIITTVAVVVTGGSGGRSKINLANFEQTRKSHANFALLLFSHNFPFLSYL